jgi:hypothetical protein
MPLPPRDHRALHISLNPSMEEFHRAFPLSRFTPSVGLFKLFKLSYEGVPLASLLDTASWITLACLEDYSADYVINYVAGLMTSQPCDRRSVNEAFVFVAAPFLARYSPVAPAYNPSWYGTVAPLGPPAQHRRPSRSARVTHVSESEAAASSAMSAAATAAAVAAATAATAASSRLAPKPAASTSSPPSRSFLSTLHGSVLRLVCAIVGESGGAADFKMFENPRLKALPPGVACKALREFAHRLRRRPATSLDAVLDEFDFDHDDDPAGEHNSAGEHVQSASPVPVPVPVCPPPAPPVVAAC